MARCSGVCPNVPSAFITSASVFHSFVFSSSLKSWSTVVGLVPSNKTRTLSFFFTLHFFAVILIPQSREKDLRSSLGVSPRRYSEMFRFAQHDKKTDYFVRLNFPVKR